jgi:hypothetical protein
MGVFCFIYKVQRPFLGVDLQYGLGMKFLGRYHPAMEKTVLWAMVVVGACSRVFCSRGGGGIVRECGSTL